LGGGCYEMAAGRGSIPMGKVIAFSLAVVVAAAGSAACPKSSALAPDSEAVATTVRILPLEIIQFHIGQLLFK
jgi:hypothetical protein